MNYYAHSPKDGIPPQPYDAHICDVVKKTRENALNVAEFGKKDGLLLLAVAEESARLHDLGKLESENQKVLSGKVSARILPYHHQDAGVAHFVSDEFFCLLAAVVISAHHKGLPNFSEESNKGERAFRDEEFSEKTNLLLPELIKIHNNLVSKGHPLADITPVGDIPVFMRLLMSCITDADHTNTAIHYRKYPQKEVVPLLRPDERITSLDNYVAGLSCETNPRNALQKEMYSACRDSNVTASISSCDSPVGSGKTTAVMAHLLAQAQKRGLRRIFVILPFTNIIQQSVNVYRKALVLPGENPEDVVAELHHRADFESEDTRHLNALWKAPIIVTTAVAFFETLASNSPATLRRLHQLPGSAIFLDESHAALPTKLLPIAWHWMNVFADEWSCYWVLASGSLCRFWQIEEIQQCTPERNVPEIIDNSFRNSLALFEHKRISYKSDLKPKTVSGFIDWLVGFSGPRLVIVNTVQSAATLAYAYSNRYGRENTEHLSTALSPNDRDKTLSRVIARLKNKADMDWTLFATSCAEAGLNLSFRNGFRELCALISLLQAAGRVDRLGKYFDSQMWTFVLADDNMLIKNPSLKDAIEVLRNYFVRNIEITPDLTTDSIIEEIRRHGVSSIFKKLLEFEGKRDFVSVNNDFKVIDSNNCIAVVDKSFADRIINGKVDWRELQRNSVQIARSKLGDLRVPEIMPGIFHWNLCYDDFLGYMAGVVKTPLV